ncbi:axial budding pattern protein 2 [Microdochium nivale]|nr:axial budding pattern protein 2 [Microdochium nivale]
MAGVHFLWRCNDGVYCCADNRVESCCEGLSSEKFVVEVGSITGWPGAASPLESGEIVPLDMPAQGTSTPTSNIAHPARSGQLDLAGAVGTPQDTTDGDRNHSQTLAIGVGVGLPLIVAILSVLLWCRLRTRSGLPRRHASSTDKSAKGNNGPHYLHDFNG